jgi:hypothetical protein
MSTTLIELLSQRQKNLRQHTARTSTPYPFYCIDVNGQQSPALLQYRPLLRYQHIVSGFRQDDEWLTVLSLYLKQVTGK